MKNYLLLLFCFLNLYSFAQTEPLVTLSPNHNNILYFGIEYTLEFYIADAKPENINITSNSVLYKLPEGLKYKVVLNDPSMTIFAININNKGKHLKSIGYQVKTLPPPTALIGNNSGGKYTTSFLLSHPKIEFKLPVEYEKLNLTYTLSTYELTVVPKDTIHDHPAYFMSGKNEESKLSEYVLDYIRRLKPGDLLTIYNIEALGPDKIGLVKIQEPISITIE